MAYLTIKAAKIYLVGIFLIFITVALSPLYQINQEIAPLVGQKEAFTEKAKLISDTRNTNLQLSLLENTALVSPDTDFSAQWQETANFLKIDHKASVINRLDLLNARLTAFQTYYANILEVGQENRGLVGEMRKQAHSVEQKIESDVYLSLLLQMRRREKDFLLRKKEIYADMFMEHYKTLSSLVPPPKIQESLNRYKELFLAIVEKVKRQKLLASNYSQAMAEYSVFLVSQSKENRKEDVDIAQATYRSAQTLAWINILSIIALAALLGLVYRFLKKENQERLQALQDKLKLQAGLISQEKLAGLGTLAAGIAHEIKNPLAVILNASELIREDLKEGHGRKVCASVSPLNDRVLKSAERASLIVRNMLSLAHPIKSQKKVHFLDEIILESYDLAFHSMRSKTRLQVEFVDKLERKVPLVCSRSDISQALINIFENAFYALKKRKESEKFDARILCILQRKADGALLKVSDNGCGIPSKDLPKIMEPFYTTKPEGEGTGLGMSFVFRTAQDHNAQVRIDSSEKDRFTTIEIFFKTIHDHAE